MKSKKENKVKKEKPANMNAREINEISNAEDLRAFLINIKEKLTEENAPPMAALAALRYTLNRPDINSLLDNENRELARDIWLHLRQAGLQVKSPSLLFTVEEQQTKGPLP